MGVGDSMERTFIMTRPFDSQWNDLGLDDRDLADFQNRLKENPIEGDLIQGTGGLRKTRIRLFARGKRSGARVTYLDLPEYGIIYLLMIYAKNEKQDLTRREVRDFKVLVDEIRKAHLNRLSKGDLI
jgi:hypothetical protein